MSAKQIEYLFSGQFENVSFSKVAHLFSFCEARSKMVSNECRATKKCFFVFRKIRKIPFFESGSFFSFCEARSKMVSNKRRATKCHVLKIAFLLWLFNVCFSFKGCFKLFFWEWVGPIVELAPVQ